MGSAVTDTEEDEAKDRAKEILQEFLRNKARAAEVERQLSRAFDENERLIRLLQDKKYEMARDRERHARELDHLRRINHEQQQKLEASKHEVRKVAQTCAQRTADTAVQLQNREGECGRLEEEVLAAREQMKEMRAEAERLRVERDELDRVRSEVPERAQQRIAELARRVLEISKEKAAADQLIMEGKDKIAAAMQTIEEFRRMQQDTQTRLQETERARDADKAMHDATVKGLQQELEMQAAVYTKYVERLGAQPTMAPQQVPVQMQQQLLDPATALVPQLQVPQQQSAVGSPSRAQAELQRLHQQQLQQLELQLEEKDSQVRELQDSLAQARRQLEEHWRSSVREKQSQFEQLRQSQQDSDFAMQQMRQDLEASQDKVRAMMGEKRNFESLQELYEQVKSERDDLRKECFAAALEAEAAKRGHSELGAQLKKQQVDRAAQEKLAEELFREREAREQAERALSLKEDQFRNELSLRDRQLDVHQDAYRQGQKAGRDEQEIRMREVERERAAIEEENARLRAELQRMQEVVQKLKEDMQQKDKELRDWGTAFQTAEQHKVSMGLQQDELRGDVSAAQQEKASAELRAAMLQQHVERLEAQLRNEQDRAEKLSQANAERELGMAQREVDFRDMEARIRQQAQRQHDALNREHQAEAALERQKVAREMEVLQREAGLRDQVQRREQERLLEQTAQQMAGREMELGALRRALDQARGQHGQLQHSVASAANDAAVLGHQLGRAAGTASPYGGARSHVSPSRQRPPQQVFASGRSSPAHYALPLSGAPTPVGSGPVR
eukprot:TRINITY_DN1184_c0_g3_i1.p1 TRINITY_DN1184_c0_g3~~TRINITY_DN1184_c0_g3_i1.p1  ORF type:complete len:821 (+),score=447.99 TRINITY_DN1184_c0_g3_i1:88-2463(+)